MSELSRFGGRPVRLFLFTRQGASWRFCTGDRDLVFGAHTYLAAQIDRDEIRETVEPAKDRLKIKFAYLRDPFALAMDIPSTQPLGDIWNPYAPSDPIGVVCMAAHYGSEDAPKVEFIGRVVQPIFTDVELTLSCERGAGDMRARNVQGAKWQKSCWKTPYSTGIRGCNMLPATFEVPAEVSVIDGVEVTAAAFAASTFALRGGEIRWTRVDGLIERRSIVAHSLGSDTVTLAYTGADLAVGIAVTALPTCPGSWAACEARANTVNYGGAIYKPVSNPHRGASMSWG
jgi:hypothetical protein